MLIEEPKKLSPSVQIDCYCCENERAEYRCRFRMGELQIQVCLCRFCIQYDTTYLFESTVGLPYQKPLPDLDQPGQF